ncbi:DNA protecting protein DprA [Candidatus Gottesmanbacteria bacterium RIFCSPLOWO2_01_FULL_43_11b]|uniref:DNA protecting protein DprA n=1 Tax=Candidatus Gottesmanbacteria bacterium RIFCSPLOWO2_01_FULL_43_11b TaxID=1798392 RepID=A0A1F6AGJ6_9BACT|nr:MAG: DNA protecting protein DprA [Candidatus Gottesmanbacteria bacterium RIFCSPLOWO2_01_FULL_43_11b]
MVTTYPRLLAEISDPPDVLYVKGDLATVNLEKTIAVVGTRTMTPYGRKITKHLVTDLVKKGFTIVSGMAIGVDSIAHQSAIDKGGKTIAVLGCGVDIIFPPSNARLYWNIVNGNGVVVSEIPPGTRTSKEQFVTRNRIISGLSLGVVVIEGSDHSGALITAKYAAEQGREVFAVPGPITSKMSQATNILLKNGAKLVESADDIIEEL